MTTESIAQEILYLRGQALRFTRIIDAIEASPMIRAVLVPPPPIPVVEPPTVEQGGSVIPMAEIERRTILHAVRHAGNALQAAKLLGMGKTTVYRKLKEYGY